VVVARGAEVGAHRDAHRPVVALLATDGGREARRDAVGGDDDGSAEGHVLPRAPALRVDGLGGHADDAPRALVDRGSGHARRLEHLGARGPGVLEQDLVERRPGTGEAEARVGRELGPLELDAVATADDPKALVADPAVLFAD